MSAVRVVFRLVNPHEQDFTGFKGTYHFRNGRHVCVIDSGKVDKRAKVLKQFYGAVIDDGTSEIPAHDAEGGPGSEVPVQGGVQSDGSGPASEGADDGSGADGAEAGSPGSDPSGDGHSDAGDDWSSTEQDRLLAAVKSLDPADNEHWTNDGRPRIDAVEKAYGKAGVKRADVEAVAPGYTRPVAE